LRQIFLETHFYLVIFPKAIDLKDKKVIFIRKKIQQPFLLLKFNLRLVTICVDLFKYG